eukprot:scaffold83296_cov58-Cyclotella_meneghiniana.AAC.2
MPNITYVTLNNWVSGLNGPQLSEGEHEEIALHIPLTNIEFAENIHAVAGLDRIMKTKIHPAFIARTSPCMCIVCQRRPSTRMINTITLHNDAPGGPTIVDHTPFPICESADCNSNASRVAHEYRRMAASEVPSMAQAECEKCENCKIIKYVSESGRMKRCARCKARLYCSKQCQKEDWKNGHKLHCKSVD